MWGVEVGLLLVAVLVAAAVTGVAVASQVREQPLGSVGKRAVRSTSF